MRLTSHIEARRQGMNGSRVSTLDIGVIGCGLVFERLHLPALLASSRWRMAAACDRRSGRLDIAAAAAPSATLYRSVGELLTDSALDAVLVATPPDSHVALTLACLEAGLHVLVEKPLATRVADARRIEETAKRCRRHVAVGFNRRFRSTYRALKARMAAAQPDSAADVDYELISDATRWPSIERNHDGRSTPAAVLTDIGSHQTDLLSWLFAQNIARVRVTEVQANGADAACSVHFEVQLSAGATLRCHAGHGPRYVEQLVARFAQREVTVFPTGLAEYARGRGRFAMLTARLGGGARALRERIAGHPNMSAVSVGSQFDAFAARILGEPSDVADAGAGARSVLAVAACIRGCERLGQWIDLQDRAEDGRRDE